MNKHELVKEIAQKASLKQKDAKAFLDAFINVVLDALKREEKIEIRGFGTFTMKKRAPRTARNPKTGKKIKIPAKVVPYFKFGRDAKSALEKLVK